jgi:hypothetical protein
MFWFVSPFDHKNVYGVVPPDTIRLIAPEDGTPQVKLVIVSVTETELALSAVPESVEIQLLLSVILTV